MYELKHDERKCLACQSCDCLTRCQYMAIDTDTAKAEIRKIMNGEDSFVLHQCATCYACEEYCPKGNHPFYLIVERQEERGILPTPHPLVRQAIQMGVPQVEFRAAGVREPVISMCMFTALAGSIQGKLYEGVSILPTTGQEGMHFFCQLMYLHFARASVIKQRLPQIIDNIARHGIKELICFHDECYAAFASYAPAVGMEVPFKPIHLFEYLYNRLNDLRDDIKPLNLKVAYQRPCSSRLSPDKLHFVDDIFELIGVESVEREYVGENALCCASLIRGQRREGSRQLAADVQRRNIGDMVQAGAQACVFNCPYCFISSSQRVAGKGLSPVLMGDLCRLAVG